MANVYSTTADQDDDVFQERSAPEQEFDLQEYLRIVRKHKWPILLFTAVITVLGAYYAMTATPIYRATSTLLIESQQKGAVSFEGWVSLENENADYYATQIQLIKSRELGLRVVRHLDLTNHPEFGDTIANKAVDATTDSVNVGLVNSPISETGASGLISKVQSTFNDVVSTLSGSTQSVGTSPLVIVNDTVNQGSTSGILTALPSTSGTPGAPNMTSKESAAVSGFLGRLTVLPVKRTKLVKISFESADPAFAARVANTVGEQYIFAYLDSQMESSNKLAEWTNEQLVYLKSNLDLAKTRVLEYQLANGLVDVNGSVSRLNEQEMSLYTSELASVRSQLSDAEDLRRNIQSYNGDTRLLESVVAVQADPIVREIKIEMGQQQRELDELSNRYGHRHPKIVDARSRIGSLQANLDINIQRVIASVEKNYSLLRQRVASVQAKLNQGKQDIQALSAKNFELADLEREIISKQTVYQQFFNRVTEANSADGLESANARVSDYAVHPRFPFKPKKQLIVVLAALGALVLSMLMAFLYEQMDDTVKSLREVETKLGLNMLGLIPLLKSGFFKTKKSLPLNPIDIEDKRGTFFESINTIRTALVMRESESKAGKIVVVTSSVPGEGKSTTAMNIAYSFSQIEKVLLIDADLRRPTIAKALGLGRDVPGLSSLLTRTGNPKECIRHKAIDELDVICSGPMPDHPLEILSSPRFKQLLGQISEHYDRIIIDCAPAQAVSDPLVLSKVADTVVYCIKSGSTAIQLARRGLDRLRQVNADIAGVVMTQVDVEKLASYGGDYYYQGYYDYYGYNEKGETGTSRLRISPADLDHMGKVDDGYTYDFGFEASSSRRARSGQAIDTESDFTMPFDYSKKDTVVAGGKTKPYMDELDIL
jgi:succinoglycan biosynthesis transport protein ExoP